MKINEISKGETDIIDNSDYDAKSPNINEINVHENHGIVNLAKGAPKESKTNIK